MKFLILALLPAASQGFVQSRPLRSAYRNSISEIRSSLSDEDAEKAAKIKAIVQEEALNPETMAETAQRMKSMKPSDMDSLIKEMDSMDDQQKAQLKAMGMDPKMMERSMKMMRDNPSILASAQKMMEKMSPEQLAESSRLAQEQMKNMSPDQLEEAAKAVTSVPEEDMGKAVDAIADYTASARGSSQDPNVIDSMYKSGEFMSRPPSGGVTFRAFSTLAPIACLRGARESDLSEEELKECWAEGSRGAARVDRVGFGRVWAEVQELFEGDLMDEARDPSSADARAGIDSPAAPPEPPLASGDPSPQVGASLTNDQMSQVADQVKSMKDSDIEAMLAQMENMGPAEETRLRAMGVDPGMMKKSAQMMKSNPLMRKAAQAMMGKMSPEQMQQAGQQAQKQMAGMTPEELKKAVDGMSEA